MKTENRIFTYPSAMILTHLNFPEINIDIPVIVRRSNRKSISLQVTNEKTIIMRVPVQAKNEYLLTVIHKKEKWLYSKLILLEKRNTMLKNIKTSQETCVLYRGKFFPMKTTEIPSSPIDFKHDAFWINSDFFANYTPFLKRWYQIQCLEFTSKNLQFWEKKMNVYYSKLRITDVKSYWGTCSSKGVISINWRIVMAPEEIHHYLLVHELSHLVYMNHSPEFWKLVGSYFPDYKIAKKWLRENSYILKNMI